MSEIVSNIDDIIEDSENVEIKEQDVDTRSMNVEVGTNVHEDFQIEDSEDVAEEVDNDDVADNDSEYTEIDLTENPLYQVLSTFFESSEGYNLCDIIIALKDSVDQQNQLLKILVEQNSYQ